MTALEFFYDKINGMDTAISIYRFKELFEQAKEMEKQQIMQAVYNSMGTNFDPNMGRAEQYYNETFKSE